jgi:hypothetical protein
MDYSLGVLFLMNTIEMSVTTAKSGRITKVGSSGTVGVSEGLGDDVETG